MTDPTRVADDERILRHVPEGRDYQGPGPVPKITSLNFNLRRGETGLSVTRAAMTSAAQLLAWVRSGPGSRVAVAVVGDVRALGLEVVPVPLPDDAGHAEIRSAAASLDSKVSRREAAAVFRILDLPSETSP